MAIILKKVINGEEDLELDSRTIIGVIGQNSYHLISLLHGSNIFLIKKENSFYEDTVYKEMQCFYEKNKFSFENVYQSVFKELGIKKTFADKKIENLSDSEKKILKYVTCFISNKSIIVIDEPFLDLDYNWKKKIISLIKNISRNTTKTIIICSDNSGIIYLLCKKVLLTKDNKCYYGDVDEVFENKSLLKEYNVKEPEIVQFVNMVREKKVDLGYVKDIRDLIKEVYKSV